MLYENICVTAQDIIFLKILNSTLISKRPVFSLNCIIYCYDLLSIGRYHLWYYNYFYKIKYVNTYKRISYNIWQLYILCMIRLFKGCVILYKYKTIIICDFTKAIKIIWNWMMNDDGILVFSHLSRTFNLGCATQTSATIIL